MAIAAGVKACNLGYKTKFYTVTELVLKLAESRTNGTLEKLLRDLRSLDLLILDEWGYVPVDKDGSQLLFRGEKMRVKGSITSHKAMYRYA